MTTMHQMYGDNSDHTSCEKCGMCATCGDCECREQNAIELFEERAAILEYEAGWHRLQAETQAQIDVRNILGIEAARRVRDWRETRKLIEKTASRGT